MRHSDLTAALADEFGPGYAASLMRSHVLVALDNRTGEAALADGIPPRAVWAAICEDFEVPMERRFGRDRPKRR